MAALTVRSLVHSERRAEVEGSEWFFCDLPDCDVVYFTPGGGAFRKQDLTIRVGIKETEPPRTLCYCFGHTIESIREEIERTGRSTVATSIARRIKRGECRCETLNPRGVCCLGDGNRAVREAFSAAAGPPLGGDRRAKR